MEAKSYTVNAGAYRLEAVAVPCGDDLAVTVCGGTRHHIGACAVGVPQSSLQDAEKVSASVSVFCVTGHKDDEVARHMAQALASRLGCVVSVSVGIHIEGASSEEIRLFVEGCETLAEEIASNW